MEGSKIDTQGLSYKNPNAKGSVYKDKPKNYPPFKPKKINLISDLAREELKHLINEVLDERERRYRREDDSWLYRGTY